MNIEFRPGGNASFQWTRKNNGSYICTATAKKQVEDIFRRQVSLDVLKDRLAQVKGCFSLVVESEDRFFLASDIAGGFPLLYSKCGSSIIISDDAFAAAPDSRKMRQVAALEYRTATYVANGETLIEDMFQVQAGEIVTIDKRDGEIEKHDYWSFSADFSHVASVAEYDRLLLEVFTEMAEALDGRRVFIPLSGGLDSRTVAVMLHRIGYDNVTCFSYGRKGCFESETARRVASKLGYELVYFEYTPDDWAEFYRSKDWDGFLSYAFSFCRIGCVQPTMAVKRLAEIVGDAREGVVVPGHISYNSAVPIEAFSAKGQSAREVAKLLLRGENIHDVFSRAEERMLVERISKILGLDSHGAYQTSEWLSASWNLEWRCSQTLFYNHDVRNYDYFGFGWELPFWDIRVANYWRNITLDQAYGRRLYHEYCEQHINPHVGVSTALPKSFKMSMREVLKRTAPLEMRQLYRCIAAKVKPDKLDVLGWRGFTEAYTRKGQTFNSYIAEYCLDHFVDPADDKENHGL